MKKAGVLLAVLAVMILSVPAFGDIICVWNDVLDGSWHDPGNWTDWSQTHQCPNAPPDTPDEMAAFTGNNVELARISQSIETNQWRQYNPNSTVIMEVGSYTVTPSSGIYISGTFIQHGGTFIPHGHPNISGHYIIDGGSINADWGHYPIISGKFTVMGTSDIDQIRFGGFNLTADGIFEVVLDSSGDVETVVAWQGNKTSTLSGVLSVNDDAAEAAGNLKPGDRITVLDATANMWLDYRDLTLDNPNWKFVGKDTHDHGNEPGSIVIEYVPEPVTLVLLGLGGCLVLLRRRK